MKELTKQRMNHFIKKTLVRRLVLADVTALVNEIEMTYGSAVETGLMGESAFVANGYVTEEDFLEQLSGMEYVDEDVQDTKNVFAWYIVHPEFIDYLDAQGEVVVRDFNLWGVVEKHEEVEQIGAIKDFIAKAKILCGEENAIFSEKDLG